MIVLQEIFGVDGHIRDVTRRYAEAGYFAFAPDLYSVAGKRPSHLTESRIEAVKLFMDRVPPGEARDPEKRLAHLANLPERESREVGESLQGLFGGAIIYYGRSPDESDVRRINCPVLGFYGEMDGPITGTVPELAARMKSAGKRFEYHVFHGAYHAFFNDQRKMYHPAAARWSFARALEFLAAHLAPDPRVG